MQHYPVNLCLTNATVVVVGAGVVGQRKIARLATAQPKLIRIIDPKLTNETLRKSLELLFTHPPLPEHTLVDRPPQGEDFVDATLAFVATDDRQVNRRVAEFCKQYKVLCNRADAEDNDFTVPAQAVIDNIAITVSTGGGSPALAKHLRLEIESLIEKRYTGLCRVLERIRPLVLGLKRPTAENTMIFTSLVKSPLGEFLAQNNKSAAHTLLREILPDALHGYIEKVLYDF